MPPLAAPIRVGWCCGLAALASGPLPLRQGIIASVISAPRPVHQPRRRGAPGAGDGLPPAGRRLGACVDEGIVAVFRAVALDGPLPRHAVLLDRRAGVVHLAVLLRVRVVVGVLPDDAVEAVARHRASVLDAEHGAGVQDATVHYPVRLLRAQLPQLQRLATRLVEVDGVGVCAECVAAEALVRPDAAARDADACAGRQRLVVARGRDDAGEGGVAAVAWAVGHPAGRLHRHHRALHRRSRHRRDRRVQRGGQGRGRRPMK